MTKKRKSPNSSTSLKKTVSKNKPLLFVLLFAVVGSLSVFIALAAPTSNRDPLSFQTGTFNQGRHVVKHVDWLTWCGDCYAPNSQVVIDYKTQDPWVDNSTQCMWDTDDYYEYSSSGSSLAAGASASIKECSYEYTSEGVTPNPNIKKSSVIHAANFNISASSPNLDVTQTYSWDGGSQKFTATPVFNSATKRYEYKQCMTINGVANGTWQAVPNSHGGYGVPVTITTTVTNPTSRSISKIGGTVQYGWQQFGMAGCKSSFPPPLGT